MSAVEQLENGIRVQCADGFEAVCKPLTLKAAKQFIKYWETRGDPNATPADRATARLRGIEVFADLYPELADHISPGDVELLIPDFFFAATGAIVPATDSLASTPTGTPPSDSTAPSGASSPV